MAGEFIAKLSQIQEIDLDESFALQEVFSRTRCLQKGETVFTQGQDQDQLYIVKSGWFFSYTILTDGSRQIHEIFTAGDLIGAENLSWSKTTASVACAVAGDLSTAPISQALTLLRRHPRLDSAVRAFLTIHNILLIDRLTAIARLDAYNRIAYFLSDALARQNLMAEACSDILKMPLSQNIIADALGLSSVHVSRQFGKLIQLGLVRKIGRKSLKILNVDALHLAGDYKNRFESLTLTVKPQNKIHLAGDPVFMGATKSAIPGGLDLPL